MNVVIDAQLIAAFYKDSVLGAPHECTGSPTDLFERLGVVDIAYVDDGGHIEAEWRRMGDPEWFDAWFGGCLINDDVRTVVAPTLPALVKALRVECGFPTAGGDVWYIRTAVAASSLIDAIVALVTEDTDFFDPTAKGSTRRRERAMRGCTGPVARRLKGCGVEVRTVAKHLS